MSGGKKMVESIYNQMMGDKKMLESSYNEMKRYIETYETFHKAPRRKIFDRQEFFSWFKIALDVLLLISSSCLFYISTIVLEYPIWVTIIAFYINYWEWVKYKHLFQVKATLLADASYPGPSKIAVLLILEKCDPCIVRPLSKMTWKHPKIRKKWYAARGAYFCYVIRLSYDGYSYDVDIGRMFQRKYGLKYNLGFKIVWLSHSAGFALHRSYYVFNTKMHIRIYCIFDPYFVIPEHLIENNARVVTHIYYVDTEFPDERICKTLEQEIKGFL